MHTKKWIIPVIFYLLLSACTNTSAPEQQANKDDYTIIRTSTSYSQNTANKVKEYIGENEAFDEVYAVNTDSKVVVALLPKHHDRFHLKDFRSQLEKELKDEIHPAKLELSTDKKIALELEKLEENLKEKSISKEKLEKELERIIKLSKEQT